jgi:hypothetical protein
MKFISDIDLTLLDSKEHFHGSSDDDPVVLALQESFAFQSAIFDIVPYPWVKSWKRKFARATSITLISGRGEHLRSITDKWIRCKLGLQNVKLVLIGFRNEQQYLDDKTKHVIAEIREMDKIRGKNEHVLYFDDYKPTLLEVHNFARYLRNVKVYRVKNGELSAFSGR